MKHIVILCISVIIFANSQELTIEEASKLRSYNHTFPDLRPKSTTKP